MKQEQVQKVNESRYVFMAEYTKLKLVLDKSFSVKQNAVDKGGFMNTFRRVFGAKK